MANQDDLRDRARYRRLLKLILEGHLEGASTSEACELALALDVPEALPRGYEDRATAWERLDERQRRWIERFHEQFDVPGNVRTVARENLEARVKEVRRAQQLVQCPSCEGAGYTHGDTCETCEGDRTVPRWLAEEARAAGGSA